MKIEKHTKRRYAPDKGLTNRAWCKQHAEFAEVSIPDKPSFHINTAAVIHIGIISVDVFEHTSNERPVSILKAVQSC